MDDMDGLFETFMGEVNNIKSAKRQKLEKSKEISGGPEEQVERLTAKVFNSAYEVLQCGPDITEAELTKRYKQLSIMIHPDKCKHENAAEAFQVLAKAYQDIKDPAYKDKYIDIIDVARKRVKERREKENLQRKAKGETPLDLMGGEFEEEAMKECDNILGEAQEKGDYASKVREANEEHLKKSAQEQRHAKNCADTNAQKWARGRDKRVAGWQVFMRNVESKNFKSKTWHEVGKVGAANAHHKKEERMEKTRFEENPAMGLDTSYKTTENKMRQEKRKDKK
eukprot:gnl/MRDRNA2_/MRDRNA2_40276_c0_seq1.p1 gnl/MRDRNA2_/MRDRNA2_40276_c0~~gnl/MRDRNA2_/MRDRNA2_40276_c0_seq1.p1  ORF type:complete len:282 (+),score=80.45 gnl/MRDRNA2_/MRDRNA2_40276_c0_seq1:104-949(+)